MSCEEVYTELAKAVVDDCSTDNVETRLVMLLKLSSFQAATPLDLRSRTPILPSWMPDWRLELPPWEAAYEVIDDECVHEPNCRQQHQGPAQLNVTLGYYGSVISIARSGGDCGTLDLKDSSWMIGRPSRDITVEQSQKKWSLSTVPRAGDLICSPFTCDLWWNPGQELAMVLRPIPRANLAPELQLFKNLWSDFWRPPSTMIEVDIV